MTFYPNERMALFIDGANFYSTAKGLGVDIDYRKLLEEFKKRGRLLRAIYYTALIEDQEHNPVKPLVDWLDYNGFMVVTKSAREFYDSMGKRRIKGDMDMEMAVDMLELAPQLDHIILFSGDGDFRKLVEALQRKGVRVSVVSTLRSQPPMISDDLRRQADSFIDLSDLAPLIGRPPREGSEHAPRFLSRGGARETPAEFEDEYEDDEA
jgi:uncharacterized LabA/DUF88 family protein